MQHFVGTALKGTDSLRKFPFSISPLMLMENNLHIATKRWTSNRGKVTITIQDKGLQEYVLHWVLQDFFLAVMELANFEPILGSTILQQLHMMQSGCLWFKTEWAPKHSNQQA